MNDNKPIYESRALTREKFQISKQEFSDWEYHDDGKESVVYLRKHTSGPKNTESLGWRRVEL